MTYTYKLVADGEDPITGETKVASFVIRKEDAAVIPFDPANIAYQAYLKWIADGNTPEAAE
tara:strand:- start:367 stop:549 length:183 start_codon:yes stop_codon:yes gene_type:complete